jgi:hypothetical protein
LRIDKGHRKNHFVPIGYLKHFANGKGKIYAFDKKAKYKSNEILETTPSQICYEYNRYLIKFPKGEEFTMLETGIYAYFDSRHAKAFQLLNDWDNTSDVWSMDLVCSLEEFVPIQYWRSPASDAEFGDKLKNSVSIEEFGLTIHKGKIAPASTDSELHKMILMEQNMTQILRPILAMSTFGKSHPINDRLEWRVIEQNTGKPNLTSDNPVIFAKHPEEPEDFRSCVVIPIGIKKTLVRINEELNDNYHHQVWQDMIQIHQADRYVLSSDKDYLTACIRDYRKLDFESKMDDFRRKVFDTYNK